LIESPLPSIPPEEFRISLVRSSGPGGQNVNKVSTKAVLRWAVVSSPSLSDDVRRRFMARYGRRITKAGDLVLASQRFRAAGRNVADCLDKLRAMLAEVSRPRAIRRPTRPTAGARRRRRAEKQSRSARKRDRRYRPDDV